MNYSPDPAGVDRMDGVNRSEAVNILKDTFGTSKR
jgi:hypothetical protein